jgi:hypothetical protein
MGTIVKRVHSNPAPFVHNSVAAEKNETKQNKTKQRCAMKTQQCDLHDKTLSPRNDARAALHSDTPTNVIVTPQ